MTQYADRGQWAEKQVEEWLKNRSKADIGFAWHRFPDAKAARGALQAQPSDYLVGYDKSTFKGAYFLEVKETKNTTRLPRDKVGQYGKLKMFWYTQAFRIIVLVYRSEHNDWKILDEENLFGDEDVPTSFPFEPKSYANVDEALSTIFP